MHEQLEFSRTVGYIVVDVDKFDYYDSLHEESQDQRTVSSLFHSKASPADFGAPFWC